MYINISIYSIYISLYIRQTSYYVGYSLAARVRLAPDGSTSYYRYILRIVSWQYVLRCCYEKRENSRTLLFIDELVAYPAHHCSPAR